LTLSLAHPPTPQYLVPVNISGNKGESGGKLRRFLKGRTEGVYFARDKDVVPDGECIFRLIEEVGNGVDEITLNLESLLWEGW